ncbi:hypothetical protein B0A49_09817 [Cryomyces minteri]|uniref:MutL C-terminal dimerisation domain-containing protein n=1 Tax=Cryomyces minteri TaxID=331657 RepID=A0A4U0WFK7_9PEZI|nr:hypothetical protein B0A49_09817 [Cryomyces minteri]
MDDQDESGLFAISVDPSDYGTAANTQWLSVHNFRPRKRKGRNTNEQPHSGRSTTSEVSTDNTRSSKDRSPVLVPLTGSVETVVSNGPLSRPVNFSYKDPETRKRKRSSPSITTFGVHGSATAVPSNGVQHFGDWSRIKSGNPAFYERLRGNTQSSLRPSTTLVTQESLVAATVPIRHRPAISNSEVLLPGHLNPGRRPLMPVSPPIPQQISSFLQHADALPTGLDEDLQENEVLTWTNPETKETYRMNAQTGVVLPHTARQATSSLKSASRTPAALNNMFPTSGRSLRLQRNTSTPGSEIGNQWLPGFLDKWANPIFQNQTETPIPRACFDGPGTHSMEVLKGRRHYCTQSDIGKAFQDASLPTASRISRRALKRAELIAQVDRKFILVKVAAKPCDGAEEDTELTTQMLVLVDQHAADERCRIESLLAELCQPATPVESACRSGMGLTSLIKTHPLERSITFLVSARELDLFRIHAAFFAKWGILYDLTSSSPQPPRNGPDVTQSEHRLVVRSLPPSIAERCKIDPKHLIELLRTEVWQRADWALRQRTTQLITTGSDNRTYGVTDTDNDTVDDKGEDTSNSGTGTNSWLHRLADCPLGLIDLLNSRACRSAIMFNDVLSVADCRALLQRLARCAFPFQCAHGRPSLVPLLELGVAAGDSTAAGVDAEKEGGFVGAWKRWRRKAEGGGGGEGGGKVT